MGFFLLASIRGALMCCSGKPVPLASFNWKIKQASKYNFIIEIKRQITIFRSQGNPKIVYI